MTWVFMQWVARSLWKAILAGGVLGGLWGLATILQFPAADPSVGTRVVLMTSFLVDCLFTFVTVTLGTLIGMSVQTWDAVGYALRAGFRLLVVRFLWSLVATFIAVIAVRYYGMMDQLTTVGLVGFTTAITATFAFSGAYRVYRVYSVLDRSRRAEYLRWVRGRSLVRQVVEWFIPFLPYRDPTRVRVPLLWALGFILLSVSLAAWGAALVPAIGGYAVPFLFGLINTVLFAGWGVARRMFDVMKPWGVREVLYPYWEHYRCYPIEEVEEMSPTEEMGATAAPAVESADNL